MSLRPSIQSTDSGNGGFAAQFPAGRRYRSTAAGVLLQAPALSSKRGSVMLRADGGGLFYLYPPHLTRHYTVLAVVLVSLFIALGSVLC